MTVSFRKTFCPTKEEQIDTIEMLIKIHKSQFGDCSTCLFHLPTDLPGFVTDYGSCRMNSPIFAQKVCGLKDIPCICYAEDTKEIQKLQDMLKSLKGENK